MPATRLATFRHLGQTLVHKHANHLESRRKPFRDATGRVRVNVAGRRWIEVQTDRVRPQPGSLRAVCGVRDPADLDAERNCHG